LFHIQTHTLTPLLDRFRVCVATRTKQNSLLPSVFFYGPNPLYWVVCPQYLFVFGRTSLSSVGYFTALFQCRDCTASDGKMLDELDRTWEEAFVA
jgi:hypothetical protein